MPGRPAIFLDRDGVLNDVVWRDGKPASPRTVNELRIAGGAVEAVQAFNAAGYLTFVVTNQPDVRRGKMTAETLDAIHAALAQTVPVNEVRACLHDNDDGCDCRKPKAGMLLDLAARWNIDLGASWMIGDMDRDVACGRTAGSKTVLLARTYNSRTGADVVAADLRQAAAWILQTTPADPALAFQD
nr:HAD-IIIA family hydrolase [uncultured Brevundimonas sp.]